MVAVWWTRLLVNISKRTKVDIIASAATTETTTNGP